jgi:hypothetical protein
LVTATESWQVHTTTWMNLKSSVQRWDFGRWLHHEGSNLISGLIHWSMVWWKVVKTFRGIWTRGSRSLGYWEVVKSLRNGASWEVFGSLGVCPQRGLKDPVSSCLSLSRPKGEWFCSVTCLHLYVLPQAQSKGAKG